MKTFNTMLVKNKKKIMAVYVALIAMFVMNMTVYATDMIGTVVDNAVDFLAWGVGAIGVLIALFGLVTLGIGFSGDNASEKQKGIFAIVGGIIVIAAGVLIGTVAGDLISAPSFG